MLGSRYVKGGGVENWGLSRKVISRGGCLYAQTILGLPLHDLTGGYKCFRREVLEAIDLDAVDTKGYGFQIEMTYRAYKLGFKVVELPIIFVDRKVGESKMSNDIVARGHEERLEAPLQPRPRAAGGLRPRRAHRSRLRRRDLRRTARRRPRRRRRRRHQRHPPHASRPAARERRQAGRALGARRSSERAIAAATARGQTVVFRGPVMGGGAVTAAMKAHLAAGHAFVATESAAASFADDLDKVRALGARVVGEGAADEVLRRLPADAAAEVASGDLDAAALTQALRLLGVEPAFAAVAVAVQDHGYAPGGSNRVLRFSLWEQAVAERRPIGDLFYDADAVPPALTRLRAAADAAAGPRRRRAGAGRRHRPGGALRRPARPASTTPCWSTSATATPSACWRSSGRVAGVFEHHTSCLDGPGLELRLRRWLAGDLDERRGARRPRPRRRARARRRRRATRSACRSSSPGRAASCSPAASCRLEFAAPHGDMMLTGCFGLLRALRERHDGLTRGAGREPRAASGAS